MHHSHDSYTRSDMRVAFLLPWTTLLALSCSVGEMPVEVDQAHCPEGAGPPSCPEREVARPLEGWQGPVLAWAGAPERAPDCPERAPLIVYEGYAGHSQVVQCPACSCGPSDCRFSDAFVSEEHGCTEGNLIPYPAPEGWDGSCWSNGIIPGSKAVAHGFYATTLAPCEPQREEAEVSVELSWATLVRACQAPDQAATCGAETACGAMPSDPPIDFATCIFQEGEVLECPREYPDRDVFYRTLDRSAIGCSTCNCGLPEGGVCFASVRTWMDTACTTFRSSGGANLHDGFCAFGLYQDGEPLGSISSDWYEIQPGTCAPSGGEPFGEAVPEGPVTFCCRPR